MARGSIVKRRSGNYAIVYYVDGKQKWETIGRAFCFPAGRSRRSRKPYLILASL